MAKKQGISYGPNSALIQGAAAAYKNYDNAPGMYAGLDKVIEQGSKIFEEQVEKRRVVEKKFDDASEGVLMRSGALGKTLYGMATEDAKKFRELYIEGINTRDPSKKMDAMAALQNLSLFVQDHKQTNLDIAESRTKKDLSSYYEDSPAGRKKAEIITQIQDQKYSKVSDNEEGEKQFHVKLENGEEVLVTNKEYKEMASTVRNYITGDTYMTALEKARKLEIFGEDQFRQTVKQKLPRDNDEWDATTYDDVIGGKNFIDMLNSSTTLDQEIISAIDPKAWDADTDGILDPEEKANFIDAVTNTENDFFDLKTSNQILEDQLTNAGRNSHTTHWQKINDEKAIKEQKALSANKKDKLPSNDPKVFLGLGKSNGSNIYLPQSRVTDKYNELASLTQSGETGVVLGWEGSNTTRYRKYNKDDKFFTYQTYNTETGAFETATVNGKPVQFNIDEVLDDMNFPSSYKRSTRSTIVEKNGKKYKKVDGGYIEIK
tara:strand:- start:22 stop:1488 length:1467 start_codon:yes stop_codon:yes gene_type:complete